MVPTDSQNRRCGVDSDVIDKKYLVFFDLKNCIDPKVPITGCPTPQVCVEQCPTEPFLFDLQECNRNFGFYKNKVICSQDVQMDTVQDCNMLSDLVDMNRCARYYLPSRSCKF